MKNCQQCNNEVQDWAKFCPNCGSGLSVENAIPSAGISSGGTNLPAAQTPPTTSTTPNAPAVVSPPTSSGMAPLNVSIPAAHSPTSAAATKKISDMLQNRYLVMQKLGEGGMGAVYLAEDTSLFGKNVSSKKCCLIIVMSKKGRRLRNSSYAKSNYWPS
jgi:hypothetical protein